MVSAKVQLEELEKPSPRYMLELQTIRGMIQEADNMDKGLKAVLQRVQAPIMPPRRKAAAKPKPPTRPKRSTKANNVETPTSAHTVVPIPTSSTPVDAKGSRKRTRGDGTDAPTPGVTSAPSPKKVKPD
jgi:hypothetical protein